MKLYLFPNRAHDEKVLRIMQGLADRGREIVTAGDDEPVSAYLRRPLRSEQQARRELGRDHGT